MKLRKNWEKRLGKEARLEEPEEKEGCEEEEEEREEEKVEKLEKMAKEDVPAADRRVFLLRVSYLACCQASIDSKMSKDASHAQTLSHWQTPVTPVSQT